MTLNSPLAMSSIRVTVMLFVVYLGANAMRLTNNDQEKSDQLLTEFSELLSGSEDKVVEENVEENDDFGDLFLEHLGIPKLDETKNKKIPTKDEMQEIQQKYLTLVKMNRHRDIITKRNLDQVVKRRSQTLRLTGDDSMMRKKRELSHHPMEESIVDHGWLYFRPTISNKNSAYISSATLRLYKRTSEDNYLEDEMHFSKISLNRPTAEFSDINEMEFTEIQVKHVHAEPGRWEEFEITSVVNFWLKYPRENYGLVVKCDNCDPSTKYVLGREEDDDYEKLPHVQVDIDEVKEQERSGRSHRSLRENRIVDCSEAKKNKKTKKKQCCRKSMKINLAKTVGYNVVSPRQVDLFFCRGRCSRGPFKNLRALLQEKQHRRSVRRRKKNKKTQKIPGACCTPGKYQSFEIMYQGDDGSTHIEVKRDIIATQCVCAG